MIEYLKGAMSKLRKRRLANLPKSPHRSTSKKVDKQDRLIIAAQFHRDFYDEEINIVSGFGLLVHTPATTDEESEHYIEQLRRL